MSGLADDWKTVRRLWPFLKPRAWVLVVTLVLLAMRTFAQLAIPLYTSSHLDATLASGGHALPRLIGLVAALGAVASALALVQRYGATVENLLLAGRVREALLERVLKARLEALASHSATYWQSRIERDVNAISALFLHNLVQRAAGFIQVVAFAWAMAAINLGLLLVAALLAPIGAWIRMRLVRYRRRFDLLKTELSSANASAVADVLNALPLVKLSVAENRELERLKERFAVGQREELRNQRMRTLTDTISGVARVLTPIGVYVYGMVLMSQGALSLGQFAGFGVLASMLAGAFQSATGSVDKLDEALTGGARIVELLDTVQERPGAQAKVQRVAPIERIEFEDVHFAYRPPDEEAPRRRWRPDGEVVTTPPETTEHAVLRGVNLVIERGHPCALVGQSGTGKSTLIRLLCGYYEPNRGRILVDGKDLREIDVAAYRQRLSVVTHEDYLLERSFWENLCYRMETSEEARARELVDFLALEPVARREPRLGRRRLLQGVDLRTYLPELLRQCRRPDVSAGERQRIALGRQILHDANAWALDEATSNLDGELEARVLGLVLRRRPLLFIGISHRLGFVQRFPLVHVMSDGQIVASDSPKELLRHNPIYRRLFEPQLSAPPVELEPRYGGAGVSLNGTIQ